MKGADHFALLETKCLFSTQVSLSLLEWEIDYEKNAE